MSRQKDHVFAVFWDMVHSLPALWWCVRPARRRDWFGSGKAHRIVPGMRAMGGPLWGYPRFPRHATLRKSRHVQRMRRVDALINLNGSDRSSWLTFFSGARERLGRAPRGGDAFFWRLRFTETVKHPYSPEPIYVQNCRCLEKVGFPSSPPEFHVEIQPAHLAAANRRGGCRDLFSYQSVHGR